MTPELLTIGIAGLAFIAIVGVGFAFAGGDRGKQSKRIRAIGEGVSRKGKDDVNALRRKQMADATKALRDREEANRKNKTAGRSIEERIRQAGFSVPVSTFWIASGVLGVVVGGGMFFGAGMNEGWKILVAIGMAFAAGLGAPRWFLGMAIKGRQKKFINQFADAIDVIVRGVKSGLPLNECLRMIAKESSQPLAAEFQVVVDAIQMG